MRKIVRVFPVVALCLSTAGLCGPAWAWEQRNHCSESYGDSLNCPQGSSTGGAAKSPSTGRGGTTTGSSSGSGSTATGSSAGRGGTGGTTVGSSTGRGSTGGTTVGSSTGRGSTGGTTTGSTTGNGSTGSTATGSTTGTGSTGGTTTGSTTGTGSTGGTTTGSTTGTGSTGGTTTGSTTGTGSTGGTTTGSTTGTGSTGGTTVVSTVPPTTTIISADRTTTWNPGLNAVGGIPNRTTIYKTLSPLGGSLDDTAAIQAALNSCPAGQVVKLNAGTFNINGNGLWFHTSDCTLRGSGPGELGTPSANATVPSVNAGNGGTKLIKADRSTNSNYGLLYVGTSQPQYSTSFDLAADAVKGTNSLTLTSSPGVQVGEIVLIDQVTDNDTRVFWGPQQDPPGGGSRRWFCRQDRSLAQMMEVTAVNGNTVTFSTPFHITFQKQYTAQLTRYANPFVYRAGVEDLYVYGGMGGDGNGNIPVALCAYCWVKNVQSAWSVGTSIGFYATFRSVLRDSYIHETPDPNPGGAGYLTGINLGASENLVENNVMWSGNKNIVMRASGGGNVIAYNYMDNSWGSNYPNSAEAGLNAGHFTTPHMELLEGNYSHNYKGDSFWGNSIYITVFRNQLSAIRAARPPLNTYMSSVYPYMDLGGRTAVDIQAYSYNTNIVGNVLGSQGQKLLSYESSGYSAVQNLWGVQALGGATSDAEVNMWQIGAQQTRSGWFWVPDTYTTQQRDGNWDWVSQKQLWYGVGGQTGVAKTQALPDSLYLNAKPTFFGSNPWPWVNPSDGSVTVLPAKACLEQGKMPTCMM